MCSKCNLNERAFENYTMRPGYSMLNINKWIGIVFTISIAMNCTKELNSLGAESSSGMSTENAHIYSLQELTDLRDTVISLNNQAQDPVAKRELSIGELRALAQNVESQTGKLELNTGRLLAHHDSIVSGLEKRQADATEEQKMSIGIELESARASQAEVKVFVESITSNQITVSNNSSSSSATLSSEIQIEAGGYSSAVTSVEPVNDLPVYVGEAVLSGIFSHDEMVSIESGGTCSDPYDAMNNTQFRYAWYRDADPQTKYDGNLIDSVSVYVVTTEDMDGYLYGVALCEDDEGGVTADTTEYSSLIKYRRVVKVQTSPGGSVDAEGEYLLFEGEDLIVKAVPTVGYRFIQWFQSSGAGVLLWGDSLSDSTSLKVVGGPATITAEFAVDVSPPSIPQQLKTIGNHDGVIELEWSYSSDNVGVVGYRVYNNDVLIEEVLGNKTFIGGLSINKISVSAIDAAGLESAKSAPLYHIEAESRASSDDITYSSKDSVGYAGSLDDDRGAYRDNATWTDFELTAGTYLLKMRKSDNDGSYETGILLYISGEYKASISHHGYTGGWYAWECFFDDATFDAEDGTYSVRLEYWGGNWNVDWLEFIPQ